MDSLSGAVEQLIFDNAANGYTVLRLRPESGRGAQAVNASSLSRDGLITVMGNLLYTAVTRTRKLCVLTGSRRAISIAIHNNKVTQRFTAADWRLRGKENLPP